MNHEDPLTPYGELAEVVAAVPLLLRERRRGLGISQREAARRLGVASSTLDRIESGEDYNSRILPGLLRWLGTAP